MPRLLTTEEKSSLRQHQARLEKIERDSSGLVEAGWAWYERGSGVVAWGFRNLDRTQRTVILLRNSTFFGDAYWPVYSANRSFRTQFLYGGIAPPALSERSVPQNVPPLGLVQFGGDLQRTIVCFVFTLSPGQAWAMLEGGFSQLSPPSGLGVYNLTPLSGGDFCVTYDPQAVRDWNEQSRTRLDGYAPNPSTFNTWLFQAESIAPYQKVFPGDSVATGKCAPETRQASPVAQTPQTGDTGGIFPPVFPGVLSPPLNP